MSAGDEHFSIEEVTRALSRFDRADAMRLTFIARAWARRVDVNLADDLLNEAIARVMDGRRAWPLSQDLFTFLSGVMRSVSFEWHRKRQREAPVAAEALGNLAPPVAAVQDIAVAVIQVRERVADAIGDDPLAAAMFTLRLADASPTEITAALGLDATANDTVSRRLKRQLFRLFPEGAPL